MSAKARLAEEALYEQVVAEIADGVRRDGLWAKAHADSAESPEATRALYIKLRVQSLIDEAVVREEITAKAATQIAASESSARRAEEIKRNYRERYHPSKKRTTVRMWKTDILVVAGVALVLFAGVLLLSRG